MRGKDRKGDAVARGRGGTKRRKLNYEHHHSSGSGIGANGVDPSARMEVKSLT